MALLFMGGFSFVLCCRVLLGCAEYCIASGFQRLSLLTLLSIPHVTGETVPAERAAELEAESGRLREELTQAKEEVATLKARLCAANPNARTYSRWLVPCFALGVFVCEHGSSGGFVVSTAEM